MTRFAPHGAASRWLVLLSIAVLTGCASFPTPEGDRSSAAGRELLEASADAHGLSAYRRLKDINVSYDGRWFDAVTRLQPVLVDSRFRGTSEERLLVGGPIGQAHRGADGVKQVAHARERTSLWYNGRPDTDAERIAAARLVAEGYRLFLLGPIDLLERNAIVERIGDEIIDGRRYQKLFARLRPGIGHADEDRVLAWIDAESRLVHRLWISADALASTRGVIAEIDLDEYRTIGGVRWPTRFFERLKRPFPLDVHTWRLVGLDLDRGYSSADITAPTFQGAAAAPARPLPSADPDPQVERR